MRNNDTPSMDNIYNSTFYSETRNYEQNLSDDFYKKAQMPFQTGIIPHFLENDVKNPNIIKSLSGNNININDFKHGNMQHFLKKGITQNVEQFGLNKNMGYSTDLNIKKKEVAKTEFFSPTANLNNNKIDNNKFLISRTNISQIQNNISPIQSVRVGPGLNRGFTSEASGGFQQSDTINYVMPKNINDLRPLSNQKSSTYTLPLKPKNNVEQRGMIMPISKNRSETVFEQTEDNWFKGQSILKKDVERPEENITDTTARNNTHINYYGTLKHQNEFISNDDDYGKNTIIIYDNERNLTQIETPVANFSSIIKAMVSPITDAIKITMKEYFVDTPRLYGNAMPQLPKKSTLYDPETHIMKTTIKETTIHEGNNGILTGMDATYSALFDNAKTTTKETTIHEGNNGILTGMDETYSALYDTTKTTTKETTIHEGNNGYLGGNDKTYSALNDTTKTTTKETTIHEGNNGYLGGNDKTYSALNDTTKTTTKETTIHEGNNGYLGGNDKTYTALNDTTKTTTKETTIHEGNNGYLGGNDKTYSALNDTTKTTTKETTIHEGNNGYLGGNDKTYSALNDITKTTTKETTIHESNNGYLGGNDKTYSALNDITKTTIKETTIHEGNNGNLSGMDETYSSLFDTAKTTTKETTIHEGNNGNLTGMDETYSALYDTTKTTTKETTIHEGNGGYMEGKQYGYVANNDKLKTTTKETLPARYNVRNINNTTYYSTYVYDPSIVAKTTVKETTVTKGGAQYGFLGGMLNSLFGGYLIKEEKAKNTQRQNSLADNYGIAGSKTSFTPTDREADYNAEIDGTRENILIKAGHTPNGAGKFTGLPKENVNMVVNKKQIDLEESERIGTMGLAIEGLPIPLKQENITKQAYRNNDYNSRLDSSILSTLIDNDNIIKINPIRMDCEST